MRRFLVLALVVAVLAGGGYWYTTAFKVEGAKVEGAKGDGAGAKPAAQAQSPAQPQAGPGGGERRPVPVVIRPVEARAVPDQIPTIGTAQPLASVAIKARVDTVVEAAHFTEGQEVKAGDLLFTLDDRALRAQLLVAEANLERDRAQLAKARGDLERYSQLVRNNAVTRQQYDAAVAAVNALESTIKAGLAAAEAARVSLGHTRIVAPMDGRTGTVLAKPGATVRIADANPLVTITQLRPINVAFSVPERVLPTVRAAMAAGTLKVTAAVPGDKGAPAQGVVTFIDSQVDVTTGTILVKGEFPNADTKLWPGQFVDVVLTLRVDPDALTLPAEAVQSGQQGRFVYAVRPDRTVEARTVKVARTHDGLAVIAEGLKAGERVVVDGQSRLFPGAPVVDRAGGTGGGGGGGEKRGEGKPGQPGGPS